MCVRRRVPLLPLINADLRNFSSRVGRRAVSWLHNAPTFGLRSAPPAAEGQLPVEGCFPRGAEIRHCSGTTAPRPVVPPKHALNRRLRGHAERRRDRRFVARAAAADTHNFRLSQGRGPRAARRGSWAKKLLRQLGGHRQRDVRRVVRREPARVKAVVAAAGKSASGCDILASRHSI